MVAEVEALENDVHTFLRALEYTSLFKNKISLTKKMNAKACAVIYNMAAFTLMCFPPYSVLYVPILTIILLLLPLFIPILNAKKIKKKNFVEALLYFSAWGIVYALSFIVNHQLPSTSLLIFMLYGTSYLLMSDDIKQQTFSMFVKVFAVILALGIMEYVFYLQGMYIPIGLAHRDSRDAYDLIQGLFNFFSLYMEGVTRFQSLAEEPGLIGTLCALLLFVVDRRKHRKAFWIFIVAGVLTFSLAFYVLFALYLISLMRSRKGIVLGLLCILTLVVTLKILEETDTVQHFMGRIEMGKDADNRTSDRFDKHFNEMINSSDVWFGKGCQSLKYLQLYDGGNAGGRVLFYQIGVVGMALLFFIYTYLLLRKKGINIISVFFIVAFWASFYQRETISVPYNIIVFFTPMANKSLREKEFSIKKVSYENRRDNTAVEFGRS